MVGTSIGPYQVLEKLGSGGMGEVFLCHDSRLHRKVALKCLTGAEADDARANILREARAVARLTHPHIAGIYDVLEHDGRAFIVMEYVEGESLRARLQRSVLSPDETIAIGRQLASALAAAHRHGVIHRDLKPSNVQLMADGTVKVLDFGVAKTMPRLDTPDEPTTTELRSRGRSDTPGTPVYMAPEQLVGGHVDVRSDVYSLGVVLFEMATGRRPHSENNAAALAVAMATSPPPPPDAIDPRVPRRLSSVIVKALQREPFNRYQTADELGAALDELTEPTTRQVVNRVPRFHPAWTVAIVSVTVAIVTAAVWRPLSSLGTRTTPADNRAAHVTLAILPVDNPNGDVQAEYLGAGIAAVIAGNFGSIPGLAVLPRSATAGFQQRRDDFAALRRELVATHVVDLAVRGVSPKPVVGARLRRIDTGAVVWDRTVDGDVVTIERTLLEELGRALEASGALPRALSPAEWSRVTKLPTTSGAALQAYAEARALLDRYDVPGNIDRAIGLLRTATATDPNFAIAYAALGDALWRQYERDKQPEVTAQATAAVLQALRLDPELAPVHYSLGNMQFVTGRYEEAVTSLRRALTLQPDSDECHRLLGRVLAAAGDTDGAVAEVQRAIALRPYWDNYYSLGYVLYNGSRYREAVEALRKTTELQPTFAGGYQMLGTTYHMLGDLPQAIGNYEHAARLGPNAAAYANLALAYYSVRRFDDARNAYLEAIKRDPRKASLRRDLADVYVRLGRQAEARANYEQTIALAQDDLKVNPRNAIAVALIAISEARLGRRNEAERHAAEAVVLAPNNRDVRIRVVKVYAALNDRRAGLAALQAAVRLGWEPAMIQEDDEVAPLRTGPEFEKAIAAGLAERKSANDKGAAR